MQTTWSLLKIKSLIVARSSSGNPRTVEHHIKGIPVSPILIFHDGCMYYVSIQANNCMGLTLALEKVTCITSGPFKSMVHLKSDTESYISARLYAS